MTDFLDEEEITKPDPFFLGVIGTRTKCTLRVLIDEILNPILAEVGRVPEKVILPAEGESSIYLADWADSLRIPNQIYEADWRQHQRRAKIFRDARIQYESTHFLIFLNQRSTFNEKLALRLVKQEKRVFTVAYGSWDIEELVFNNEIPPSSKPPSAPPAKRGCKRDTGKEKKQLPAQSPTDLERLLGIS
jgi:hypothetical protein